MSITTFTIKPFLRISTRASQTNELLTTGEAISISVEAEYIRDNNSAFDSTEEVVKISMSCLGTEFPALEHERNKQREIILNKNNQSVILEIFFRNL